jgi:thioredoxin-like negative regulator of GroEL
MAHASISLVLIRSATQPCVQLSQGLRELGCRYGSRVRVREVEASQVPARFARFEARAPTVLVLRRGRIIAEATGARLPLRELDRVVRRAVETS